MRNVYKRYLMMIGVMLLVCIIVGVAYLFYNKVMEGGTEVVVVGDLSINYLDSNKIKGDETFRFSITNNSAKDISYNLIANQLKNYSRDVTYQLVSSEASVNINGMPVDDADYILGDNILIQSGKTQNFTLKLNQNNKMSFQIKIKVNQDVIDYFYTTILKDNQTKKEALTKVGEEVSITNEGLIESYDDFGTSYYFRGKVENNYVLFANQLWRIVRINGDGTVKLVLNKPLDELANYHNEKEEYLDIEKNSIMTSLTSYYDTYLKNKDEYIANTRYCKETLSNKNEKETIYNAYSRIITNQIITYSCLGEPYTSKIGLLSPDEVLYAGATFSEDNKEYYLYVEDNENIWWTSTLAKANAEAFFPFSVTTNGKLAYDTEGIYYRGLRPTISLLKKITVKGKGTQDEPYEIKDIM